MGRKTNKPVGTYEDKRRGITITVYLTPDCRFTAKYGLLQTTCNSREELDAEIRKMIKSAFSTTWYPVIEVTELEPFHSHENDMVGLTFERYYIGVRDNGGLSKHRWVEDPADLNIVNSEPNYGRIKDFHPPQEMSSGLNDGKVYQLNYTEEMWLALNSLQAAVNVLHAKIHSLISTEEGREHMESVGAGIKLTALPAPKDQELGVA